MDRKKIIIIAEIAVLVVAAFLLFGYGRGPASDTGGNAHNGTVVANDTLVGGDRDAHGCIGSAGYTWCATKQECLRVWEEPCEETPFGQTIAEQANELWGDKSVLYPATNEVASEGWWRTSFRVPPGATYSNLCYIFTRGNLTRGLDGGTTFFDHGPVTINGSEVCEIAVKGGLVNPCGNFTVHIDMKSMIAEYNKTEDNWADFFSCEPAVDVAYCQAECQAMMAGLMNQERSKMNGSIQQVGGGYCKNDNDCVCLSGSGVPFVGCGNVTQGAAWFGGSDKCARCVCRENKCVDSKI